MSDEKQQAGADATCSAYIMRLAALKGNIWDDIEEINVADHLSIVDAFSACAAKALSL